MPSPERIALAYARNWFADARKFPKDAAIELALLLFVALMLAGFQFQIVTKAVEAAGAQLERLINLMPILAGTLALFVARANPVLERRAAQGNWTESLPVAPRTRALWAVRRACYAALGISLLFFVFVIDLLLLGERVTFLTAMLLLGTPPLVVMAHGAVRRKEILSPHDPTEHEFVRQKENFFRRVLPQKFRDPLARGVVNMALAEKSAASLWLTAVFAGAILLACMLLAARENQPQLLLIGAVIVPLLINAAFEPRFDKFYRMSRSLPLRFRQLARSCAESSVLVPSLFVLCLLPAMPFVSGGGYWFLVLLASVVAMAALLFVKLLVALAFPQSKLNQTLFMFAAALAVGVFSMQAPLIAPVLGLIVCAVWLAERGWGAWEFGYGERSR
ncbi:hypothetical protein HUU59_08245 [bacterium]|nr:hypothetical protein [bacterium]